MAIVLAMASVASTAATMCVFIRASIWGQVTMFLVILLIYFLAMSMSQVRLRANSPTEQVRRTSLQTRPTCPLPPPIIWSKWKKNDHQRRTVPLQRNICHPKRKRCLKSMPLPQSPISHLP